MLNGFVFLNNVFRVKEEKHIRIGNIIGIELMVGSFFFSIGQCVKYIR